LTHFVHYAGDDYGTGRRGDFRLEALTPCWIERKQMNEVN
jgi:hypothetical protein